MMTPGQYHTKEGKADDQEERAVSALRNLIRDVRTNKSTGERNLRLVTKDGGITQIWDEGRRLIS